MSLDNAAYVHIHKLTIKEMTPMRGSIPGIFEDESFDKENGISCSKQLKNIYHLWLIDDVGEPKQYTKWFDTLQSATEADLVIIHINCYGGIIDSAVQLVTQIKTCEAQVVCQIESACCSAATMIALACDGLICYPHSYMMIHTASGGTFGKQSDIKKQEEFFNDWLERFFDDIYKDFLTKKEIESVLDGKDLWLNSEDVMERFRHRVEIINKENAKNQRKEKEHMKKLQSFMSNLQNEAANTMVENIGAGDDSKKKQKKPAKKQRKSTNKSQAK